MKYLQKKTMKSISITIFFVFALGFLGCVTGDGNDDDPIEKYLAIWQVSDQPARLNYEVLIERNPSNSTEILLKNFADLGGTAIGLVVGNSVIIDKQTVKSGYQVEGTGTYIGSFKLQFDYELDDGIDLEKRKSIFTK